MLNVIKLFDVSVRVNKSISYVRPSQKQRYDFIVVLLLVVTARRNKRKKKAIEHLSYGSLGSISDALKLWISYLCSS